MFTASATAHTREFFIGSVKPVYTLHYIRGSRPVGCPVLLLGRGERLADVVTHARGRSLYGVAGEVCVPVGGLPLDVAEEFTDYGRALAERHSSPS